MSTFWNGEPCKATKCRVMVGRALKPTWWCAAFEGTTRKAVKVEYADRTFFIDDEDGMGWKKVTEGLGSPRWGHSSLPDDSVEISA